tara:strand:- start:78 stop:701 length:624 start_codon:yes stop_codon:yes gene_type:complete
MGGVNERGQDKYGINAVSMFGDYTAYNEKRVGELENIVADQRKRGLEDTIQMQELKDRTGLQESIEADEEQTAAEIAAKNKMTLDNAYLTSKIKPKTAIDTYKEQLGATDDAGITSTIITPTNVEASEVAYQAPAPSYSPPSYSPPSNGGGGGGTSASGGAGAGGGSQQAKSSGSTNSGRSDGGWGWKDGGLVTRKPYGDGGIVDLL